MELVTAKALTDRVFVVNLKASDPAGVGVDGMLVGLECTIMQQPGAGGEIHSGVLDVGTVAVVRKYLTPGINRPWAELENKCSSPDFPMYDGARMLPPVFPGGPACQVQGPAVEGQDRCFDADPADLVRHTREELAFLVHALGALP